MHKILLIVGSLSWLALLPATTAQAGTFPLPSPEKQPLQAQVKQAPPAPPTTPPPNRTRSGGSLGDEATCGALDKNLMALVPVENPVLTASEHPTFWFYVPYGAEQVEYGEFSILVGPAETTRLYQTRFTLPSTPGMVSISLPNSPAYALKPDTPYHWYFKLHCLDSPTTSLQVDGWVQRVALTPERQRQIADSSPEVWYDALTAVAQQFSANPQDAALQNRWRTLLTHINAADLIQEPIVGAVRPLE